MPAADVVLLPLCIGLGLVGVVVALIAFAPRRARTRPPGARASPSRRSALYLTGLLRLVWDAVVAVVRWATGNVFDLAAWIGFGVLALGRRAVGRGRRRSPDAAVGPPRRRRPGRRPARSGAGTDAAAARRRRQRTGAGRRKGGRQPAAAAPQDDDMAEIEALLKSRGIQ